jgi:hypothetical protein
VLDAILDDPSIGKVVLTRNPLESYVSLEIARQTGQWRLTNPKVARRGKATFDPGAFDAMLSAQRAFRDRVQRALQVSGQAAFWIDYEQIADLDVLNGLAAFLGSSHRLDAVPGKLKRQNPGGVEEKVANADAMRAHLATLDPFVLSRSVHMEPARGPAVPTFLMAAESALLHLPIPGGPVEAVRDWLAALDGAPPRDGLSQRDLRPWMRDEAGFVTFAVLRHPLARAWDAFEAVRAREGGQAERVRRMLANQHHVPWDDGPGPAFLGFLRFLKAGLGGQTSIRIEPEWSTQSELLAGMAQAVLPQRLLREAEAQEELDRLAARFGRPSAPLSLRGNAALAAVAEDAHEEAAIDTYRRDYVSFGFGRWRDARP